MFEKGLVWFVPASNAHGKKEVRVHFDVQLKDHESGLFQYNNKPIRMPTDNVALRIFPEDIVFDLHRLIWRPYRKWKEEKGRRTPKGTKKKAVPSAESSAEPRAEPIAAPKKRQRKK